MSNIRDLYTNLSNMPVPVGNKNANGYDLNEIKPNFERADLPVRLLSPIDVPDFNIERTTINRSTFNVSWEIRDLCLLQEEGLSTLKDEMPKVVDYTLAYIRALMTVQIPTGITLETAKANQGIFAYPEVGDTEYYGVEFELTFKELIK